MDNLNIYEQMILDAVGPRNFVVMRAIAKCESGMNPLAINWATRDVGLFQINMPIWGEKIKEKFGYTIVDLLDAKKNIEVAKWIWDRNNDGTGDIKPWVATTTTCFREELK
jgi:hypothetical protein